MGLPGRRRAQSAGRSGRDRHATTRSCPPRCHLELAKADGAIQPSAGDAGGRAFAGRRSLPLAGGSRPTERARPPAPRSSGHQSRLRRRQNLRCKQPGDHISSVGQPCPPGGRGLASARHPHRLRHQQHRGTGRCAASYARRRVGGVPEPARDQSRGSHKDSRPGCQQYREPVALAGRHSVTQSG